MTFVSVPSLFSFLQHEHFMQIVLTEVKPLASLSSRRPAIYAYDYTAQSHTMQMPSVPVARFHYEPSPMQVRRGGRTTCSSFYYEP